MPRRTFLKVAGGWRGPPSAARNPEYPDRGHGESLLEIGLVAMALAGTALLSACGPTGTPFVEELPPAVPAAAAEPTASPSGAVPTTTVVEAAPTQTRAVVAEQFATDPSTVELAAGRPTIVKFFAFW